MTQDETIRMAREAGFNVTSERATKGFCGFAALVAEPWIETNKALAKEIIELQKQAEQEPVAWYSVKGGFNTCGEGKPLYAYPVRTKDLTPEEIGQSWVVGMTLNDFARAVIAADREKNRG